MLYKNIAEIYANSRPSYPNKLFSLLLSILPQENFYEYFLDLGCGTGELLLPLSKYFMQCYGIDIDEDMLAIARKKINNMNNTNIHLIQSSSEKYLTNLPNDSLFNLVTAGRSFHWMQQDLVAQEVYNHLKSRGVFAVLGEANGGIWKRKDNWAQEVLKIIFEAFPYKKEFIPAQGRNTSVELIENNLKKIAFDSIEKYTLETKQRWSIPMILNLFYSGSGFLEWLATDKELFEKKVHTRLMQLNSSGIFESITQFGITCCIK